MDRRVMVAAQAAAGEVIPAPKKRLDPMLRKERAPFFRPEAVERAMQNPKVGEWTGILVYDEVADAPTMRRIWDRLLGPTPANEGMTEKQFREAQEQAERYNRQIWGDFPLGWTDDRLSSELEMRMPAADLVTVELVYGGTLEVRAYWDGRWFAHNFPMPSDDATMRHAIERAADDLHRQAEASLKERLPEDLEASAPFDPSKVASEHVRAALPDVQNVLVHESRAYDRLTIQVTFPDTKRVFSIEPLSGYTTEDSLRAALTDRVVALRQTLPQRDKARLLAELPMLTAAQVEEFKKELLRPSPGFESLMPAIKKPKPARLDGLIDEWMRKNL